MTLLASFFIFFLTVSASFINISTVYADGILPRTILGLYDSSEDYNKREDNNWVHNHVEMVLNYLGMKVKLYDINQGLPDEETMNDVYGVLTWFLDEEMPQAEEYCRWVTKEIRAGKKFVVLKNLGALIDKTTKEEVPYSVVNQVYKALGLEYIGQWTDNPFVIDVIAQDQEMTEFERTLKGEAGIYDNIKSIHPENKIYLKLNRKDIEDGESDAVVTTPWGGFVLEDYGNFMNYLDERMRWRINPFEFFNEALKIQDWPRFDTTTLFGYRIFYSHIDGDGFRNVSEIDPGRFASEIIRDEILEKYDLPITVSVITSEVDPTYLGSTHLKDIAKDIFRLPNVEVGVHGFSHPLDWDQQLTSFVIKGYSRKFKLKLENDVKEKFGYPTAAKIMVDRQEYLDREIRQAVEFVNHNLVPEGKKVSVYQWTGNCRPPKEAIDLAEKLGIGNINGGDSRFDRWNPSYTDVAPLTRQVHGQIQIYTSNANENIYTDGWDKNYFAYSQVIETFEQTEDPTLIQATPRRISPINVYYHFYSGERKISLDALKKVYDYVLTQNIIPLFTSEYVNVVKGFLSGKIDRLADGGWRFSEYGRCQTIRLEHTSQFPDLQKSKGIIGFSRWHNSLYIYLTDAGQAILYLTDEKPTLPYLIEASNIIQNWQIFPDQISFATRGFKDGMYRLANLLADKNYEVIVSSLQDRQTIFQETLKSNHEGELTIHFSVKGYVQVTVQMKS